MSLSKGTEPMKKKIKDAIEEIGWIVADLEEMFDEEPHDMVMVRTPYDFVMMVTNTQDHIDNLRDLIDFILCDGCNKRLSRKERNR